MESLLELLNRSARGHTHLCPRQVLGVRLGLCGLKSLGFIEPPTLKRMIVILETNGCFADGVIAATQCNVGHRTLFIEDMGKTAAVFVDVISEHIIRVAPQLDIRQKAIHFSPGESSHYLAQLKAYQNIPDEEMFSVAPVVLNTPIETILSFPGHRVNCDQCGEEIINEREVLRNGHIFCQTCAGTGYYKPEGRAIHFPQAIKQDFCDIP